MPNAFYDYTDFGFSPLAGGGSWNAEPLTSGVQQLSDPLSMQGTASKIISVVVVVPNLAIADDLTITILKKSITGAYQDPDSLNDNFRRYNIPITQNLTTIWDITLYAEDLDDFKIEMDNQSGQQLAISVGEDDSSITPAS
jgi:hypothetical protein